MSTNISVILMVTCFILGVIVGYNLEFQDEIDKDK